MLRALCIDSLLVIVLRSARDIDVGTVLTAALVASTAAALLLTARLLITIHLSRLTAMTVTAAAVVATVVTPVDGAQPLAAMALVAAGGLLLARDNGRSISIRAAAAVLLWVVALAQDLCRTSPAETLAPTGLSILPITLALLGGWAVVTGASRRRLWWIAVAAGAWAIGFQSLLTLGFWVLCGVGLDDARVYLRGVGRAAQAGGVLLAGALVSATAWVATVGTPGSERDDNVSGQWQTSRNAWLEAITVVPEGAALVQEDLATDLLIRALPARVRDRRTLHGVTMDDRAVADALANGKRVFVLPRAAAYLAARGARLESVGAGSPFAEVVAAGACSLELSVDWQPVAVTADAAGLAVVADDLDSRGPVYILVQADAPVTPAPMDWPDVARRGFHVRVFGPMTESSEQDRLAADLPTYGAEAQLLRLTGPFIARIEMWRTPLAPQVLRVHTGPPPSLILARLATTQAGTLRLCAAY